MKKTLQWFGSLKDRFAKKASEATHRAVSHSNPVYSPVMEDDVAAGSSPLSDKLTNERAFARVFWVTGAIVFGCVWFLQHSFGLLLLVLVAYLLSVGLE